MGNRCVITTPEKRIGIYMHWNGGRDSVEPILAYCRAKGYRKPEDDNYGWARMCQVIGNFFGGENSVGIDTLENLDCNNWDNGVYIIQDWQIVGREYYSGHEQQCHDFFEMLHEINEAMPPKERLSDSDLNRAYDEYMQIKE